MSGRRQTTPRGMAELTDFRLQSPDTVFGTDITLSLFSEVRCERCKTVAELDDDGEPRWTQLCPECADYYDKGVVI